MDDKQARLILSAYRPSGKDGGDPFFADALERARRDNELGEWFAGQLRFDRACQQSLRSIEPPAGLREVISLGNKVAALRGLSATRAGVGRMGVGGWMALAAALVLFLGLGWLFGPGFPGATEMSADRFVQEIGRLKAEDKVSLGKMSPDRRELHAWLARRGAPHGFAVPESMEGLDGVGCQSFLIRGAKVSLLCFMADGNQLVHLFVVDEGAITDPPGAYPVIRGAGERAVATWSGGGHVYLLTGVNIDEETLRLLI